MTKFTDSLRGYSLEIHRGDDFKCRYCGLDGTKSFESWLTLSQDHLLPRGHPQRNNQDFIVTACNFCNTADNRYFDLAEQRGLTLDGLSAEELVAQRKLYVENTRTQYRQFWNQVVAASRAAGENGHN